MLIIRPGNQKVEEYIKSVGKDLFWNKFLLLLHGSFIELMITSYIAIANPVYQSTFSPEHMVNGEVISFIMALLTLPVIYGILPGIAIWIIFQNSFRLEKAEKTIGALFESQLTTTTW